MDFTPLMIILGFSVVAGTALISAVFFISRVLFRGKTARRAMRITPVGVSLCVGQLIIAVAVIAWGRFHPDTFLGQLMANEWSPYAVIFAMSILSCAISVVLQRRGVVLYYRVVVGG